MHVAIGAKEPRLFARWGGPSAKRRGTCRCSACGEPLVALAPRLMVSGHALPSPRVRRPEAGWLELAGKPLLWRSTGMARAQVLLVMNYSGGHLQQPCGHRTRCPPVIAHMFELPQLTLFRNEVAVSSRFRQARRSWIRMTTSHRLPGHRDGAHRRSRVSSHERGRDFRARRHAGAEQPRGRAARTVDFAIGGFLVVRLLPTQLMPTQLVARPTPAQLIRRRGTVSAGSFQVH